MAAHASKDDYGDVNARLSWMEQCEEASRALLTVRDHAYALVRCLRPASNDELFPHSHHCAEWLMLAAGLRETSIVTNGLDDQDVLCSNIFEEERGRVASASATELARMLFLWGALDMALDNATLPNIKARNISRRLCNLMDGSIPALLHHKCAVDTMAKILGSERNAIPHGILSRAARSSSTDVGRSTLCAYYVRNSLAHGSMYWPSSEYDGAATHIALGRVATRLLLFAIQSYACVAGNMSATDYRYLSNEDDYGWTTVREVLPTAHLDLK